MLRGNGRLRSGGNGFSPSQISFSSGLWLDPSDTSTAFQDSTGTTVGGANLPVGLRLDKSNALVRGTDVTNGGFDSDTAWTKGAGWTISGGKAIASATSNITQAAPEVYAVGDYAEVTFTYSANTGVLTPIVAGAGQAGSPQATAASGTYRAIIYVSSIAGGQTVGLGAGGGTPGASVDNLSIRKLPGNHVKQATSNARPEYGVVSGVASDFFDGTDDGYGTGAFSAGEFTATMDCFIAIKRNDASARGIVASKDTTTGTYFGYYNPLFSTSTVSGVGTPSLLVNGAAVANQNDSLATALGNGTWTVMEYQDLDLSLWTGFQLSAVATYMLNADLGGVILCPAQSSANRASLRRWLGARVGISI